MPTKSQASGTHSQGDTLAARMGRLAFRVLSLRPFGVGESESIMQFAALGTLICHCASRRYGEADLDRREVCRSCGGSPIASSGDLLDRQASSAEIRAWTELLRLAGIRAQGVAIPETVRSLGELHAFLDESKGRKGRKPPRRPNAPMSLLRAISR